MRTLSLKIDKTFDITNEIQTYGSDGTKHRVGSFEGEGIVYIEFMGQKTFLYSYEKEKRRNQYSGRLDTFMKYFDRKNVDLKIKNFLLFIAKENNLKIGINFDKFVSELVKMINNDTCDLISHKVFSYKIVKYHVNLP